MAHTHAKTADKLSVVPLDRVIQSLAVTQQVPHQACSRRCSTLRVS